MQRDCAAASPHPAGSPGTHAGAELPLLEVRLASPRGFCAGVDRAIRIVEEALRRHGAPVYVRHEIVHNSAVVAALRAKGAVFVPDLADVPAEAPVVFSAHGVSKSVAEEAGRRGLAALDATCPLVAKVHREAERHHAAGCHVLLIGHAGHPEVEGTLGQLPARAITLVQSEADARSVRPPAGRLAFVTQTTLSVDDTAAIVGVLRARFPALEGPRREDICYATTNRQAAVKAIAPGADLVLVVGSPNSSNSQRLREAAERAGAARALLVSGAEALEGIDMAGVRTLGLTAGASAPEALVQALLARLATRYRLRIDERRVTDEDVSFKLPAPLAEAASLG